MMKKKRSPRYLRWLYLMVLPLVGVIVFTISCTNKQDVEKKTEDKITEVEEKTYTFNELDVVPEFPGGQEELINYISTEIKYPEQAKLDSIEGKLFVKFTISKTGSIENVKIENPTNELLDAEALRVVSEMPEWSPGQVEGKNVKVEFVIPIVFKLK